MKKMQKIWMLLMMALLTTGMMSCSNAEEGENQETWVTRNLLNSGWSLNMTKVNGQYEYGVFYFQMNLRADGRRFELNRFYYKDGVKDESTNVVKSGTFVINQGSSTIEATDSDGKRFFTLKWTGEITSSTEATITFHDIYKTYDVLLNRSTFISF